MAEERAGQRAGRRVGYMLAIAVNGLLLYLINVAPGWEAWSFLTPEFGDLVRLVDASLVSGLVLSLVTLVVDTPFWRGLRDGVSATFALVVLARLFVIFPFAIDEDSIWRIVLRAVLGLAMVGAFIGIVAGLGRVARAMHVRANYRR
jgi:hypothetical protein